MDAINSAGGSGESASIRVGISPDFHIDARNRLEQVLDQKLSGFPGLEWSPIPPQPDKTARPEVLNQFDALLSLGLRIGPDSLRGVDRLALVARWGVGYDMIDVDALTEACVALAITPNAVRRPVAEAIFAFIFSLTTNLLTQDKLVREGKWRGNLPKPGRNILGRTLGSLGFGNIAHEMFRMAGSLGFGRLIACDPYATRERAAEAGVEIVTLEELLAESDFLTINTLLNKQTRGILGEDEFRKMKRSAYLINTARGPVVQEKALIRALQENWIAGAGLDVFEEEPLPASSPLRELDNVILSPHGLAWTEEILRDNSSEACDNILALARGEMPAGIVNKEVFERPGFQRKLARFRRSA